MNIVNFFEWGIRCNDFKTPSAQIDIYPIHKFSFQWKTQVPDIFTFSNLHNAGIISGIGEYSFEMKTSDNQAKIQDLYKKQKMIEEVHFVRFANHNGSVIETERYSIQKAIIGSYSFLARSEESAQSFKISIYGSSDEFIQTIRNEEGVVLGKYVTILNNIA